MVVQERHGDGSSATLAENSTEKVTHVRTVTQFLEGRDGREGGNIHFASLFQRVQGFGLAQEALVQLLLQRRQPEVRHLKAVIVTFRFQRL